MSDLKVYIIDSHVLVRQMMISILRTISGVKVLGSTSGRDEEGAIYNIRKLKPDVVLTGIDQPESDEMALFSQIRERWPRLPVIVMTPRNRAGATVAFGALRMGAVEYITLPPRKTTVPLAKRHFLKRVVPLLRMISRLNIDLLEKFDSIDSDISGKLYSWPPENMELVAIGGDTGGVRSLFNLLPRLSGSFPVPIVAVQHLPRYYSEVLVEELDKISSIKVCNAVHGTRPLPGHFYVAPGGKHLEIKKNGGHPYMVLHQGPREQRSRPSIDVLMRSAGQACTDRILAVFLSGGGKDGVQGARDVVGLGGTVLVESRENALLWDLPKKLMTHGFPVDPPAIDGSHRDIDEFISSKGDGHFVKTYDENHGFLAGSQKPI